MRKKNNLHHAAAWGVIIFASTGAYAVAVDIIHNPEVSFIFFALGLYGFQSALRFLVKTEIEIELEKRGIPTDIDSAA